MYRVFDQADDSVPEDVSRPTPVSEQGLQTTTGNAFHKEPAAPGPKPDPGEMAARILQLSAKADASSRAPVRKPQLRSDEELFPMDVPAVYKKPSHVRWNNDNPMTQPRQTSRGRTAAGPSFKALLFSTLLVAVAGGGAVALGLPDITGEPEHGTRQVQTETIAPALQTAAVPETPTLVKSAQLETGANKQQLIKAKDRIRQAFAAGAGAGEPGSERPAVPPPALPRAVETDAAPQSVSPTANPIAKIDVIAPRPLQATSVDDVRSTAETAAKALAAGETDQPAARPVSASKPLLTSSDEIDKSPSLRTPNDTPAVIERPAPFPWKTTHPKEGKITASVNLRQTDDKNADIIGVIPAGTHIRYAECGKWWCNVVYNGTSGYVGQTFVQR